VSGLGRLVSLVDGSELNDVTELPDVTRRVQFRQQLRDGVSAISGWMVPDPGRAMGAAQSNEDAG
jgi:hypothetical protein